MRNKLLRTLVLGLLLAIVLGMPLLFESHRIRPSRATHIKTGMQMGDVVDLLNARPGKYDGYDLSWYGNYSVGGNSVVWCSRHCWIMVWLDERGRVVTWVVGRSEPATWLARVSHHLAPPPHVDEQAPLSLDW